MAFQDDGDAAQGTYAGTGAAQRTIALPPAELRTLMGWPQTDASFIIVSDWSGTADVTRRVQLVASTGWSKTVSMER